MAFLFLSSPKVYGPGGRGLTIPFSEYSSRILFVLVGDTKLKKFAFLFFLFVEIPKHRRQLVIERQLPIRMLFHFGSYELLKGNVNGLPVVGDKSYATLIVQCEIEVAVGIRNDRSIVG